MKISHKNSEKFPYDVNDLAIYLYDVAMKMKGVTINNEETNENSTELDWELISFHAIPKDIDKLPMGGNRSGSGLIGVVTNKIFGFKWSRI